MLTLIRTNETDGRDSAPLIQSIYDQAAPARPHDLAYQVFARMGLDFTLPETIRVHPALNYSMGTSEYLGLYPTMVMPKRDGLGRMRGVELLYLSRSGEAAPVVDPHISYWFDEPELGTFMALHEPVDGVYGVAKGLASALAAHHFCGIPMCVVDSAEDLQHFQIPQGVTRLVIFATDSVMADAHALASRAEASGLRTRIVLPQTPTATWVHEFALRGAIPVDEIAAQRDEQSNDSNPSND